MGDGFDGVRELTLRAGVPELVTGHPEGLSSGDIKTLGNVGAHALRALSAPDGRLVLFAVHLLQRVDVLRVAVPVLRMHMRPGVGGLVQPPDLVLVVRLSGQDVEGVALAAQHRLRADIGVQLRRLDAPLLRLRVSGAQLLVLVVVLRDDGVVVVGLHKALHDLVPDALLLLLLPAGVVLEVLPVHEVEVPVVLVAELRLLHVRQVLRRGHVRLLLQRDDVEGGLVRGDELQPGLPLLPRALIGLRLRQAKLGVEGEQIVGCAGLV
mmetsp:Transcript_53724/g.89379  ORF Transcript_53724/g.89379 Transcript_53724/m.89379 type:complete len:266 (-) Transcript_53724:453-1250(-)